jgi:hypothetical protein
MNLSEIMGTEIIGGVGSVSLFDHLQIRGKDGKLYELRPSKKGRYIEVTESLTIKLRR